MHGVFVKYETSIRRRRRRGFTILELSVSIVLLAMLMTISAQMIRLASRQQRAAAHRAVALETVQAVAELVENTPWDSLTPATIDRIEIPERATSYLPGATLTMTMTDETDPSAKRMSIVLHSSDAAGLPGDTTRLTTWVFPDPTPPPE